MGRVTAVMNSMGNAPLAGRYVLVDQIGAGGMGSVWRAWDLRQQVFVAAKLLGQHDSGMLLRFVREQSVRINHPHVVAPSGWAAEDNLVVFTMDLVRGGSVQTLLGDHGKLPESYVAVVLDQTLQALEAVHAAGVVHRDVKPANLLLEPTGTRRPHVRLGDFGVAALIDEVRLTKFPGAIGTDGYMAPEQALGASPEPQQDLYAAGVVAIQMLTGLSPRHHRGVPEGRLRPLLEALTDEDSRKRPESASAALHDLRALGVPAGSPWQDDPEPPEVFNQLSDVAPPPHSYHPSAYPSMGASAAPAPAAPMPPPRSPWAPPSGSGAGAPSGGSWPPSGSRPGTPAGAHSGGQPVFQSPGQAPPVGSSPGSHSGSTPGSPGGSAFLSPAASPAPGSHGAPPTEHAATRATPDKAALVISIVCFLVALGLAGTALFLILA